MCSYLILIFRPLRFLVGLQFLHQLELPPNCTSYAGDHDQVNHKFVPPLHEGLTVSFGGIKLAPDAGMQLVLQDIQGNVPSDLGVLQPDMSLAEFTVEHAIFLELQGVFEPSGPFENQAVRGNRMKHRAAG